MRSPRLFGALLLTGAAIAAAVLWIWVLGPRSETTGAPPVAALQPSPVLETGVRLLIPTLGVNAPVVSLGRDAAGNMAAPEGPSEVAWYDFTPRPGHPGNAVMAGHFNWRDGRVAVFAQLAKIAIGADIEFVEAGGERTRYRVVSVEELDAFSTDVGTVLNWSAPEGITLITCSGPFVWTASAFSQRTVVHAERVPAT